MSAASEETDSLANRGATRRAGRVVYYLRDDFRAALKAGALAPCALEEQALFAALSAVSGDIYRQAAGRRTLRFAAAGSAYFVKLHDGVGWREIVKNLLTLKPPVLGARNEFAACRRLCQHGVPAPGVAAFGAFGGNPAKRRSFVVCDALDGFVSLEELANRWAAKPPPLELKRRLLHAAGKQIRAMHAAGVHHRDCYLSHLLISAERLCGGEAQLAVIDLHRARIRARLPRRWRRRDLAALLYSAAPLALTRSDCLRFVAAYSGVRPAPELRRNRRFWVAVAQRAARLAARGVARGLATGSAAASVDHGMATIANFASLGREPTVPFRCDFDLGAGGVRAVCTEVLRLQPGRRLTARMVVEGRDLVVKAFFGTHGGRDFGRERRGIALLRASGVATPALIGVGRGGAARLLAFECIDDVGLPGRGDVGPLLATLARLHRRGVRQRDLHVGNFLVQKERVFAIDGGSVKRGPWAVGRARSWRDVARLLAHFPAADLPCLAELAGQYAQGRGWPPKAEDSRRLLELVAAARRRRVAKFVAKTVRDCTEFAIRREADRLVAVARGDDDPQLCAVIGDPERALAAGVPLKRGNTATVARVGELVVKRYHVKNRRHQWRLAMRPSRARRAWQVGHGLRFLGIATARPRAMIERRRPTVGAATAYLVLDYVDGEPLADVVEARGLDSPLAGALRTLFQSLRELRISHGDTKASNFVAAADGIWVLDLDAARLHRRVGRFRRRHRRDLARFLCNWPMSMREALARELSAGGES